MVASLALMESPAIIIGVLLARKNSSQSEQLDWKELGRDAFFNGSIFLLCGALAIGALTGENGGEALKPFTGDIFKGMLCLFLLDMGLVSARRMGAQKTLSRFTVGFGIIVPVVNAIIAILIAHVLQLPQGDAFLLAVLASSASYIAVPAALRLAIPEANPGLYITMALAITFPFNIALGLPFYYSLINTFWK